MKDCVEAIDHLCSLIQSVVQCSFGNSNKSRTAAHFKGYIHFNSPIYNNNNFQDYNNDIHNNGNNIYEDFNNNAIEVKVLFDTVALCANYMSNDLFLDIKNRLHKNQYRQQKSNVALADDSKVITSTHVVTLPLTVVDDNQNTNSMNNGLYVVINMKDNDIIVGLPAIMTSFWEFFKKAIDHQIDKQNMCSLNTTSDKDLMSNLDPEYPDNYSLLEPWTVKLEEAPEEDEVPLPARFDFASSFLGKSRQEAIQEYEEMFATHVDKQMAANTDVINLLQTKGRKVFIPDNWDGIQGIEPLQIQFSPDLPDRLKPKARPINPRLWECAEKEFKRLCGYFYEESRSPHASCLVLAPKATKPFIRFCGDYGIINKYIPTGHYYIPHIRYELDRIMGYSVYIDIDLTNAFHQIRLHPDTAAKLSVQTPWGQFQPRFMPEGIGPGSAVLQETVRKLFADFQWAIIIFDNVLILAKSYKDAYSKLDIFLDRCIQHNVVLKFAKSWIGFNKVTFFGYECTHNCIELSDDRKKAIMDIPFPETGNKKVRSLLGSGVMFSPFVPHYSDLVKDLTDMTKAKFNWDESTWQHNYREQFYDFKEGLQKACALYYPDYSLVWILRTDASDYGVGAVLLQIKIVNGKPVLQPIAFWSKKFSEAAIRWPTIEKEGYAIFGGVKRFAYYLVGKEFIIETDHNNLTWMEASEVPKIVRWRIYLQSFSFKIRHIKGTENTVADALSRLLILDHSSPSSDEYDGYSLNCLDAYDWNSSDTPLYSVFSPTYSPPELQVSLPNSSPTQIVPVPTGRNREREKSGMTADQPGTTTHESETPRDTPDEQHVQLDVKLPADHLFNEVHNGKQGHWGLRETWKRLNQRFPGHGLPMQYISQCIAECPTCQKTRKERREHLVPMVRHLKPPHSRSAIGIDDVSITPHGKNGHTHITVIVNLFTKFVYLHPIKGCTAINLAAAVWTYWCYFGCTDMVISDQGPNLRSDLFNELTSLVGLRHVFSIADRHVNGCERLIKEAQRHLRALVYDSRIEDVFDDPTVIPSIQYIMNSKVSSESSEAHTPFELMFGSTDAVYTNLLDNVMDNAPDVSHVLLRRLNENLLMLRNASREYQQRLVDQRLRDNNPDTDAPPNVYQPGDYVTFDAGPKPHPKLSCRYKGPYEVVSQQRNDVHCRNLLTDAVTQFSLTDLEPFYCSSREEAQEAAMRDNQQFVVKTIHSYTGDSRTRTSMSFTVEFADGDIRQLPWSPDLLCEAYYEFCAARPHLHHLTLDTRMANKFKTQMNKQPITAISVGDVIYLDLRFFGDLWYEALELPDSATTTYVLEAKYTHWYHARSKRKISLKLTLLPEHTYALDGYTVFCWGTRTTFDPSTMVLVDAAMLVRYPQINQD